MARTFDQDTLKTLDQTDEIDIETSRGAGAPVHRTTIWIMVDGDDVFVRSVRGPGGPMIPRDHRQPAGRGARGRYDRQSGGVASRRPGGIAVNRALERKYRGRWSSPTDAMLLPDTLPTTLKLAPAD